MWYTLPDCEATILSTVFNFKCGVHYYMNYWMGLFKFFFLTLWMESGGCGVGGCLERWLPKQMANKHFFLFLFLFPHSFTLCAAWELPSRPLKYPTRFLVNQVCLVALSLSPEIGCWKICLSERESVNWLFRETSIMKSICEFQPVLWWTCVLATFHGKVIGYEAKKVTQTKLDPRPVCREKATLYLG